MNVHKLPVVSIGQLVYTPADGYTVQLPLVESGVGRPAAQKKSKEQLMLYCKNSSKLSFEYELIPTTYNMAAFVKGTF